MIEISFIVTNFGSFFILTLLNPSHKTMTSVMDRKPIHTLTTLNLGYNELGYNELGYNERGCQ
jgi:hypothetical protein